jgi:cold shock CspA family protein
MSEGIVTFVSNKGWFFAENSADHSAVYIHQNHVEHARYLKIDDRISFDVVPSTRNPGKTMGTNVKYLGHTIARQISDKAVL